MLATAAGPPQSILYRCAGPWGEGASLARYPRGGNVGAATRADSAQSFAAAKWAVCGAVDAAFDLVAAGPAAGARAGGAVAFCGAGGAAARGVAPGAQGVPWQGAFADGQGGGRRLDRESVVSGKHGERRVDLGGGR